MEFLRNVINKKKLKKTSTSGVSDRIDSETCYRRLFESAQDGILIIDADTGRITHVNPFLMNMLGYTRDDFIGKPLWRFGPLKDIRANKAAFEELVRNGYIRYEHLPLETRDGQSIEVEYISNVYQVDKKQTIQCNIRINTPKEQAERTNFRLETQLKQAQKMEAIATLAGGVAHQFNNALAVILSGLDLLEEELPQKSGNVLQFMKNASNKMSRITQELLAYSRGGKYRPETIHLSNLAERNLSLLKSLLKPFIKIEIERPSGLPEIFADRDQIMTALISIITNASEAIETQGLIRVIFSKEVVTDEKIGSFSGLTPGVYVILSIKDNGKGMDEQTLNRVFEPFFTTHFLGRGLGMASVYGIVKNHNGWISVESEVGQGTAVSIYLPAFNVDEETAVAS